MNHLPRIGFLIALLLFAGCGKAEPAKAGNATGPLSVEEWKVLPISEKYDEMSFTRLKQNRKELQTRAGWDKFMKEVVVPERKKDIPGTPGQK